MNKTRHVKRLVSVLLLLAMVLGMLPTSLFTPKAEAALTQTQLTKSETLKAEIEGLSAPAVNNQVQELPIANTDEELDAANTLLKNLSGTYYVLMSVTPTGEENPRYFALDATTAVYTGTLAAREVHVVDGSVIDADASWAIKMNFLNLLDSSNSAFSTAGYRTARTPYSMQTSSGKYLQFSTVEQGISLVDSSNSTITFFAYYATPNYVAPQYNNNTSYRLRLNAKNPDDIYFDLGAQGNLIAYSNKMLLYKIDETMVNTASLYNAILEAGEHLGTCNPYEEANYQAFLTTLEESIDLYEANNGAKPSDIAAATAAVAAQEQNLKTAMLSASSYTEQIEALAIPYSEFYPVTKSVSQLDLVGKWFALTKSHGFYWAMDVARSGSGSVGVACINVANDSIVMEDDLQHAIDLIKYEADPNGTTKYTVLLEERVFLRPEAINNIKLAKPLYFLLGQHVAVDGSMFFRRFFDGGRDLCLVDDRINLLTAESAGSSFYLFRPSPATLELYQALNYVARYGHGNANGQYPKDLYDAFVALLEESLALYQQYNNDQSAATLAMKKDLDAKAAALREYAITLTNADQLTSYIDIPVEILDFRSDTFLLEYATKYNRYAMTGSNTVTAPNIPGDLYTSPDGLTYAREGLVCEDLINGQMIYKEETVTYLAKLLLTDDNSSGDITELMPRFANVNYRTDFRTLIDSLVALNATDPDAALGSIEDTLTKVIPNKEELKVNGCVLPWSEVTTAHDLAYYALNNLWRKVEDTDVLSDGTTYNVSVPQRDRIRMYQNTDGYYTLDSNYDTVYDGYYVYNTAPHLPISKVEGTGEFMPIDNLGFETGITNTYENGINPAETDPSTYFAKEGYEKSNKTANFHFSIHAYGSFVYYESQDLYFSFEGDDDVYFFINGHSVLELGGCHNPIFGDLELNRIADELGLVDGEVYSFDMFYAERHTNGSNIRFSTNMKIVDTEMVPTKGQYGEIIGGESRINNTTGMGAELIDNALINIGDTVAYSFDILNLRSVPVYNISFDDKSLGVFVSPQALKLYDAALSNGVETKITDIKVYYRTYDHINNDITEPGTVNEDVPIVMSYDQIVAMIDAAKTDEENNFSLPKGSYRVDIGTEEQLKNLLALGAPADCQISVYGFKRNTVKEDRPYVNTLVANCYYRRAASAETNETEEEFLLTGSVSRQLLVPDVDAIAKPTVDPEQIVIDFAKEIEIPTKNLKDHIYTNRNVPIGNFVGLTATGYNGAFLKSLPTDLGCKSTASGKNTFQSPNGIYTRTANSFKFQLTEILSEIERVYAVYEISNYHVLSEDGRSTEYKYILVEIQIIPATQMYYETDFSSTAINAENYNGSLYFGFGNSDDDKRRYDTATYNYTNFDALSQRWTRHGSVVQKREVDNKAGTLTLTANDELPEDTWPCVYFENAAAINYNPKNAEIYQVRIKMENFVRGTQSGSDKSPYTNITYVPEGETSHVSALAHTGAIALSHLNDGTYITVTAEITEAFREVDNITKLRFMFGGMESDPNSEPGKLTIDYIYIGPKDDSLFFDFTNTESDRLRYESHTYRATNFDDPSNWKEDAYFTDAIIDGNLVLTSTPAHDKKTDGYASVNSGWKVEHPVREDDYVFIRMRMVGVKKLNTTPTLRFYYGDSAQNPMGNYGYAEWTFTEDDFDGEWLDLSFPLAKSPNYFAAIKYLCLSFYQVRSVDTANPGQYIFDYIFVGTPEEHERLKGPLRNSNPWERLIWSNVADGTQSTDQRQDFDYVTDTVYDMIVDREVIPENAFFVDFDNDNARYNNSSIYGGYNFDLAANGYWATAGADGATAFAIDNTEGILKLDVPAAADGSGKYGPSVATTNSYGNYPASADQSAYFPLNYTSTSSDYIQLRFRIDGCEWTGKNETVTFSYNYSTEEGFGYAEDITLPYTTKTMGEYQTLNLTIPSTAAFKTAVNVESFALHFGGIKEKSGSVGTVTIDYIFVGPKVGMPSDGLTNNAIYLSFDNDDPAKLRYSSDIYTQTNMDDPLNWNNIGWFDIDVADGSLNLTPTAQDNKNDGYGSVSTIEKLNYTVTGNEYVQVRLRIDGARKLDGYTPTFKLFFGSSTSTNLSEGSLQWAIDPIKHIDQGWITFTAPLSKSKKQCDVIRFVRPAFYAMRSVDLENPAAYVIDYIYIGPMNGNEIITPSEDALYFNFGNTDADKYRYSSPIYGGTNYDDSETVNWTLNTTRVQHVAVNPDAGTLELTTLDELPYDDWPDAFTETAHNLSFNPKNAEIFQIRFRLENLVRGTEKDLKKNLYLSPTFYPTGSTTRTSLLYGTSYTCHLDYLSNGQYLTVTARLSEAFRNCESVEAIRLYFGGIESDPAKEPGKIHIDYVYIGPSVESNPAASSLYFGFDDLAEDRERYNTDTYGYRNFDDTTQWVKTSKISDMKIDNDKGLMNIIAAATLSDDAWPDAYISTPKYFLDYKPENAEVYQIRFKLEGFERGTVGTSLKNAYINISYNHRNETNSASAVIPNGRNYSLDYLNNSLYLTLTGDLPADFINANHIDYLRLYFGGIETKDPASPGVVTIDYAYFGPRDRVPQKALYGYDASYDNDTMFSNGKSLFVEGRGIPLLNKDYSINYEGVDTYTETSFNFTGTGFDIISRTGANQGAIRAVIYKADGTYFKTISVVNKSESNLELYQVPVISANVPYGSYQVKMFVNAAYDYGNDGNADIYGGALDRGGEFYFDAIRIYDPINTLQNDADSVAAYAAYQKHEEADPFVVEARNSLIDTKNYNAGGDMEGALYIDKSGAGAEIGTYASLGPNNEIYLKAGQAIAFKLVTGSGTTPSSLDIGAKSADGKPVNLTVTLSKAAPDEKPTVHNVTINRCTSQYHAVEFVTGNWNTTNNRRHTIVTIYNASGDGILSITDIKCAYNSANPPASRSLRMVVDDDLLEQLANESNDAEPTTDPDLKFNMDIVAGAEMVVNYNFMASAVSEYEDFYLEVEKNAAGGESIVTVYNLEDLGTIANATTGDVLMYNAAYSGINAKEMGDSFATTLYAIDANGKLYKGETVVRSIKDFLMGKLEDETSRAELKTMSVDMLKYGAAAQVNFNYDVENLVTNELTEEQLALATQTIPEATNYASESGSGANVKMNITVNSKVELALSCIAAGQANSAGVKCVITDTDGKVLAELATTNLGGVMYSAKYDNVGAREMRKVITATFYNAEGTAISKTVNWSVESYVAQVRANSSSTATEIAMVDAMLTYGDSVGAYLTSIGQ